MRGWGAAIVIALLAGGFALAGSASADDVEECRDTETVSACIYDTSRGDREEACTGDDGFYIGETGAWARVGEEPYLYASAGGDELCSHQNYYPVYRDRIHVYAQACLEQGRWSCQSEADAWLRWDREAVSLSSDLDPAGTHAGADWRSESGCETRAWLASSPVVEVDEQVVLGCLAEPPNPPSPGWGEITPELPG